MKAITISEFRKKISSVIADVEKSKKPVEIKRKGKTVVKIVPIQETEEQNSWLGCMVGTGKIMGDIISPISKEEEWEVLRK